jgi:hypothetical protein
MVDLSPEALRAAAPIDSLIYAFSMDTYESRAVLAIEVEGSYDRQISDLLVNATDGEFVVDFVFQGVRELVFHAPPLAKQHAGRPYEYEISSWTVRNHRIRRLLTLDIRCYSGQRLRIAFESAALGLSDRQPLPLADCLPETGRITVTKNSKG